MKNVRAWTVAVSMLALACTPVSTVVVSRKHPDASSSPKRIFVLSGLDGEAGSTLGLPFEKALELRLAAALGRCGVEITGSAVGGLQTRREIAAAAAQFRPDAVLTIGYKSVLVDQNQRLMNATIAVSLRDAPGSIRSSPETPAPLRIAFHPSARPAADLDDELDDVRTLWESEARVAPSGAVSRRDFARGADAFVDAIVKRMQGDGLFPGCPALQGPELPPSARVIDAKEYVPGSTVHGAGRFALSPEFGYAAAREVSKRRETSAAKQRASGMVSTASEPEPEDAPTLVDPRGIGLASYQPSLEAYVRTGIRAELEAMGFDVGDPRRTLSCEIDDAFVDAGGWGYGATLRLRWTLTEAASGKVLYSGEKRATASGRGRTLSDVSSFNEAIRRSAEELAQDEAFLRALE